MIQVMNMKITTVLFYETTQGSVLCSPMIYR